MTGRLGSKLADARRRQRALELAVADARGALVSVVERHRDEWHRALGERVDANYVRLQGAVEALAEALHQLGDSLSLSIWLEHFPTRSHWQTPMTLARVPGLKAVNGYDYSTAAVVDALRVHAQRPQPVEPAEAVTS